MAFGKHKISSGGVVRVRFLLCECAGACPCALWSRPLDEGMPGEGLVMDRRGCGRIMNLGEYNYLDF